MDNAPATTGPDAGLVETDSWRTMQEKVRHLEDMLATLPQCDLRTTHALVNGMYARTIIVPAGVALTGAAHKTDHLCVAFGDITVLTDEGPKRLTGYHVLTTKAGMKRAGLAHSDTAWTTICRTSFDSLADLHAIEAELVEEPERLQTRRQEIEHARQPELEG